MAKERYQNPIVGDDVQLQLFAFNSNCAADVNKLIQLEIWFLDPTFVTQTNLDGRRLVETIAAADITNPATGEYLHTLSTSAPLYTIGCYLDIWHIAFEEVDDLENRTAKKEQAFKLLPDKWYTTPFPVVHDFQFRFLPNRIRKGTSKFLQIEIIPNVARATDLARFWENLAVSSDLLVSIEMKCGDCLPQEKDLRLLVDCDSTTFKEKCFAYYRIDSTEDADPDFTCGIYDVWFTFNFGGNTYVSDTQQLQIYD